MDTFVTVLNKPEYRRSALVLLNQVRKRDACQQQGMQTGVNGNRHSPKPYALVDAEFVKYPSDLLRGRDFHCQDHLINTSGVEELYSITAVAVGRLFVLMVAIVHVLEHANGQTKSAFEQLYR